MQSHEALVKRERELTARIGPANFEAARLLARCDHNAAISQAQKAFSAEQTQERRAYALMIEAIAAEEAGNTDKAASIYPQLVQIDPSRESVVKARNDALSGILKVQQVRKEYGIPATCS
jgi:Flp pilus assembly protein TadD